MQRRKFLSATGVVGGAAAAIAAPALAQGSRPEIRWRLASSYPKSLGTIFGAMEVFAKRVGELTDGRFKISVHPAGEVVPALQVLDAVQNGSVEIGQSASYFYIGRNPAFGFGTALPFGPNARAQNAWLTQAGGNDLLNEFYKGYDVHHLVCGNTGAQMAGWFRKEIKTVEDLKGLKFRVGGLAGMVLSKLGVVPQQLAAGDIYPALEKGVLDAAEFVGPYDDEKLGLHKVAKYYYSPGWWEGSATLSLFVNLKAYNGLPADYRAAVDCAAAEANSWMLTKYDLENGPAMRRLIAGGAQLRSFSRPVMDACWKAAHELYAELGDKSPEFKKIYENWVKFRDDSVSWNRVADLPFDNYMAQASRKG